MCHIYFSIYFMMIEKYIMFWWEYIAISHQQIDGEWDFAIRSQRQHFQATAKILGAPRTSQHQSKI